MQQIADWLEKLGLSEYAQCFAENDIDVSVLPDLTDQHLKDLGVSLGHRLKILRAIGELAGAASAKSQAPAVTEPRSEHGAERRQLTIMFCDLVGPPRYRLGSIRRTCGRSSGPTTAAARNSSSAMADA
jgi:hypothetical protein